MAGSTKPKPPNTDIGPVFIIVTAILTAISLILTCLRLWVRRINYYLGWDDYTIGITMILALARLGMQAASVPHGNGRHRAYLSSEEYTWVVMANFVTIFLLFPTLGLLKISICFLLLRIKNTKRIRFWMYIIMAGLVLTNVEPPFILLVQCRPIKAFWLPKAGKCWPASVRIYSIYVQAAYSILTDLICTLLPIVVVWKVQISMRDKLLICGLMSLGLFATISAAIRASSLGISTADLSWDYCVSAIWSNVELHLGIIAANAACGRSIWSFFRHGRKLPSSTHGYGYGSQSRKQYGGGHSGGYLRSQEPSSTFESTIRRGSMSKSEDSEIPLYEGIKQTTRVDVTENRPPRDQVSWISDSKDKVGQAV